MEWILQNKERLFSGTGLLIFIWVGKVVIKMFRKRRSLPLLQSEKHFNPIPQKEESVNKEETLENEKIVDIQPNQIIEDIESTPPFQQDQKAANYVGLKVKWGGRLSDVKKKDKNLVQVHLRCLNISVFCEVELNTYPNLKIAKPNTLIMVSGAIEKVEGGYIKLEKTILDIKQ